MDNVNPQAFPALIEFLDEIKDVMTRVASGHQKMYMSNWTSHDHGPYDCNTPACVIGHVAIDQLSQEMPDFGHLEIEGRSKRLVGNFKFLAEMALGTDHLAYSVYGGGAGLRATAAIKGGVVGADDIDHHPHLSKWSPSPNDVVAYIEHILLKLSEIDLGEENGNQ